MAKNSPRLVFERLFSVFFYVFLEEGCQTRWLASLQNSPKFVAFIELPERKSRVPSDNYLAFFLIRTFDYFCILR